MARLKLEIYIEVGDEHYIDQAIEDALRGIKEGWGRRHERIAYAGQQDCSQEHDWWEYSVRGEELPHPV